MKNRSEINTLIIGGGSAGLALGSLLKSDGVDALVLESHLYPGGSSSYFHRGPYTFDVGATTFSGLAPNRPIDLLIKKLSLTSNFQKIDPGIVFYLNNRFLSRPTNHQEWIREFENFFNLSATEDFWNKEKELHDKAWSIIQNFSYFPSFKLKFLSSYLNNKTIFASTLLPTLFESMSDALPSHLKNRSDVESFLNELLFITAQNTTDHTPHLLSAMGLFYPEDTHYCYGGMKNFMHSLAEKCEIKYRQKVISISKKNQQFLISTDDHEYIADKVISTIPIWNTKKLLDSSLTDLISDNIFKLKEECWSAFSLYFVIPAKERESLYYQIHFSPEEKRIHQIASFFVSFSATDDLARAPKGFQTVTISIHMKPKKFKTKTDPDYQDQKLKYSKIILDKFLSVFDYKLEHVQFLTSGSPSTFARYTQREDGLVGGIPHDIKRFPFDLISPYTKDDNFYLLGDTVFPGQGLAATIHGAQQLHKHLTKI